MGMTLMRTFALLLMLLAVAGCAGQPSSEARFTRWKCQHPSFIDWRYLDAGQREMELRIAGSERLFRLRREPATVGTFYSDGVIALHRRGTEALVYRLADDHVLAMACRASLINL